MRRYALVLLALAVLSASPLAAQTSVEVNKPWSLAFAPSLTTVPVGLALEYRVYVNGVLQTVTLPPLVAGEYLVPMPAFTTTGPRPIRVAARWRIVDATKFVCAPSTPTTLQITDCSETFAQPDPITLVVTAPILPPIGPPLAPGNFRLIIPVSVGADGVLRFDWGRASLERVARMPEK